MNLSDIKFYDTSSLLIAQDQAFKEFFYISSITCQELENIKTSKTKDEEIKKAARHLLQLLTENKNYEMVIHRSIFEEPIIEKDLLVTNDTRILSDAYYTNLHDNIIFVTNDLALKNIANLFFGNAMIQSVQQEEDNYKGYRDIVVTDKQLATLYNEPFNNIFKLLDNEYLIVRDGSSKVLDILIWRNGEYKHISEPIFKSSYLGNISPQKGDIYQKIAFDSLSRNQLTMLRGPAGSGKSIISLSCLFDKLEHNQIDEIIIFCNPVATINAARLGFYAGSKDEKLLDSQIGNFLGSKLGSRYIIEQLIQQDKLLLLPFSDLRGYDTTGMRAGVYITEAQNLDKTLMKLAIQRVGEDSICIIDGDNTTQVDLKEFSGANNGMSRLSQVFRGQNMYGEVELSTIHRSAIARIAQDI